MALHLALLGLWHWQGQQAPRHERDDQPRIEWVNIATPRPQRPVAPALPPLQPPKRVTPPRAVTVPATQVPLPAELPPPPTWEELQAAQQAPPAPPTARSADEIMQQAKRDLGGINTELKKEFPRSANLAPGNSAHARMERKMEDAFDQAPPKWYQAAKFKEIGDASGSGRRIYRITTALGTFCVSYASNHEHNGQDAMQHGSRPFYTNCPE
ncbi:MAG: hypothetical protein ACJ8GW_07290 [Massilia sp.]